MLIGSVGHKNVSGKIICQFRFFAIQLDFITQGLLSPSYTVHSRRPSDLSSSSLADESEEDEPCCPDNWAVWLHFETPVWAVLLLVQISTVAFLLLHGRKEKTFRQAFYVFFIAVTVADCALVLLVTTIQGVCL